MAARKVVSADFASCWAKYMLDGRGPTFNKASSEILQKVQKGSADTITRAVLKNYASSVPTDSGVPPNSSLATPASDVKVALGCLNAIRSLQSSAEEDDNTPLRWVLLGADTIGQDLNGRARSAEEEALMTEELRQLFSLKVDPTALSATATSGNGTVSVSVSSGSSSGRSPQDIMNSYAARSEEDLLLTGEAGASGAAGDVAMGGTGPVDAKKLVKTTASLTLAAFRIFPFLPSLRVGPEAVNTFLNTLISTGAWGSAISVMEQYPTQTSVATFESLFTALCACADWDRLAELALSARAIVHAASPHGTATAAGATTIAAAGGAKKAVVRAGTSDSGSDRGPFLVQMPAEELKQRVSSLIQLCLDANTTVALNAAKKLASHYKLRDLSQVIQDQELNLKFQSAITKGKWQIFVQQLEKGSTAKKLKFYTMLVQSGKYMEAAETYRSLRLHGIAGAVPVSRQQLEAQAQAHRDTYLDLPAALLDSVLVIRDQRSLDQAAKEMGLSLRPSTATPIFTSTVTAATAPQSTGKVEAPESTEIGSEAEAAAQQERNLARSVTFQALAAGLRAPASAAFATAGPTGTALRYLQGQYRLVVGLDGEWRACVYQDLSSRGCSILQIATPEKVYILDFRTLCPERENGDFRPSSGHSSTASSPRGGGAGVSVASPVSTSAASRPSLKEQTHHFLRSLLTDETVLKVGWDFLSEDIRMLRKNSKGAFATAVNELHSYLETKDVGEKLLHDHKKSKGHKHSSAAAPDAPAEAKVKVNSLSGACGEFLGRPLLKMEQMSNWDQRPLTRAQLKYASLDAHATLALFDAYLERAGVAKSARLGIANKYYLVPPTTAPVRASSASGSAQQRKR